MNCHSETAGGRRGFLAVGLRWLLCGGIVAVSGFLGRRELRSRGDESVMPSQTRCGGCPDFDDCPVPVYRQRNGLSHLNGEDDHGG